jgi:MFS transporter, ACS family, tartrate transporter
MQSMSATVASAADLETAAMRKFRGRMIPLLAICYFVYRLDLLNVGFAGLTMNKELGLSASAFGFGVGIFYWGFFFCQVPSNLMLDKLGARTWLPIIMLLWSVLSGCMAFVDSPRSFYIMRFVLGAADAGFFPGIVYYVTCWAPGAWRGRMVGLFSVGGLLAPILGGPLAATILRMNGVAGIAGWRWLFISEAIPAVILTVLLATTVVNRPADARWLTDAERNALQNRLDAERAQRDGLGRYTMRQALTDPRVIMLCLIYLGILGGTSAVGFWLPIILQQMGLSNQAVGYVAAIPYIVATASLLIVARHSDMTGERIWHVALSVLVGGIGFVLAGVWIGTPVLAVLAVCVALAGVQCAITVFWSLPGVFLSGAVAAVSVALINAVGNLGGFFGPQILGLLRDATGDFKVAMMVMVFWPIMAAVLLLLLGRHRGMQQSLAAARGGSGATS